MNAPASPGVLVVLVTYNRAEMLRRVVTAVLAQTATPAEVLVVDNASTDATPEVLAGFAGRVTVHRLSENTGGAGGFSHGLGYGRDGGHDWVWLMDDDAVPEPDALERLLAAESRFPSEHAPAILASRVEWTDGSLHPMNATPARGEPDVAARAALAGTYPIRWASFVSILVRSSAVRRYGLPYADFFIWNDDLEYTERILRHEPGVLVPDSVVVHHTANPYTSRRDPGDRFFYEVRNKIWTYRLGAGQDHARRLAFAAFTARDWVAILKASTNRKRLVQLGLRGARAGLTSMPLG